MTLSAVLVLYFLLVILNIEELSDEAKKITPPIRTERIIRPRANDPLTNFIFPTREEVRGNLILLCIALVPTFVYDIVGDQKTPPPQQRASSSVEEGLMAMNKVSRHCCVTLRSGLSEESRIPDTAQTETQS